MSEVCKVRKMDSKVRTQVPENESRIVWHIVSVYLPLTETFIYTAIRHAFRTEPVVISYRELANLDSFPLPGRQLHSLWTERPILRSLAQSRFLSRFGGYCEGLMLKRMCVRIGSQLYPSLIHAHFGPNGYASLSLKRRFRVPLVTTFYGHDVSSSPSQGDWNRRRRKLFANGDLFLVEGPAMADRLVSLGCPADRIRVQRIGIDISRIRLSRPTLTANKPTILLAARFVEKKGFEYALRALAVLHKDGFRFNCRIIGGGPLEVDLRSIVKTKQIEQCVTFLGYRKHSEFLNELSNADMLVQPSVTARDGDTEGGAPTCILEAQAAGVPIVSTYHADIPNVVLPGVSALLVPERDPESLVTAIGTLLRDSELRKRMGLQGRRFVSEHHDALTVAVSLDAIYSSIGAC